MAEPLETFPTMRRGPYSKYPWDQWGDGRVWQLERGKDFDCTPLSFCMYARARLSPVRVSRSGDTVILQKKLPPTTRTKPTPKWNYDD